MTARIAKRQVVLDRMSPADDPVHFDSSTPPSVCYGHEDDDGHLTRWWITPEDYTAFGEPEQITVTIEAGDRLTEVAP